MGRINYWSTIEKAILEVYYADEGRDVAKRLTGRSEESCVAMARKLGLKTYARNKSYLNFIKKEVLDSYRTKREEHVCEKYGLSEVPEHN